MCPAFFGCGCPKNGVWVLMLQSEWWLGYLGTGGRVLGVHFRSFKGPKMTILVLSFGIQHPRSLLGNIEAPTHLGVALTTARMSGISDLRIGPLCREFP